MGYKIEIFLMVAITGFVIYGIGECLWKVLGL